MMLMPDVSRGLSIVRDELAGWFLDLNKYRNGGDREFYLTGYSGGPYPVDRVTRGTVLIPDLLINIVGGIQPEKAAAIFADGPDDGLAARFTSIWPEHALGDDVDRYPDKRKRDALDEVNDVLAETDWAVRLRTDDYHPTPYVRLDVEGAEVFAAWRSAVKADLRS